jgi:hypothetical protein
MKKKKGIEFWVTDMKGNRIESMASASFDEPTLISKIYTGWKGDKKSFTIDLAGKELQAWINYRNLISGFDDKNDYSNSSRSISVAYFSKGLISISCAEPASQETVQLLERFAGVFEHTYTRFLDLQKAEAQAKEARIEAALEKVRSRTMGMQKSDDLFETSVVLFQQLKELGEAPERIFIALFDEKDKNYIDLWGTLQGGDRLNKLFRAPVSEPTVINKIALGWEQNKSSVVIDLSGNELKEYLKFLGKIGIPVTEGVMTKRRVQSVACFSKGGIGITTPEPISKETLSLLERFAAVFDLTYTRFLDLQKAEAQAREAKIEAALERVRAKAMAMQHSEDLANTIDTFYKELGSLNITPKRVGISLIDRETRLAEISTMNTTGEEDTLEVMGSLKMLGHPLLEGIFEHWLSQEEYHPLLRGNEIKEYNEFIKPQVVFPENSHDQVQHGYYFMFPEGWVYAWNEKKLETDELTIYRRFTSVLSLTYTRYKDLKDAEAQAREAKIELALERVRARAMAMQKSVELAEAAQLLYHEFGTLELNPFTCGFLFIKEEQNKQTAWVTLPDGTLIPDFIDFPLTGDHILDNRYKSWKQKEPLHVTEVQGEINKKHHSFLSSQVPDHVAKEIFSQIPERIIFYCANFSAGYLFIIATEFFYY